MREKLLTMRMNDEEYKRLKFVSEHHGIPGAALIRMLLRKEERIILKNNPTKPFTRKSK
jgi:predicted DNA-binding protein